MSNWRRRALEDVPDLRTAIDGARTVMALWIDLYSAVVAAYERSPPDEERIRCIYRHALWTLEESSGEDARTAVVVAFFEHLPTHPALRADVHRWIAPEVFHQLEPVFRYFLSEEEFEAFRLEYRNRRAAWLGHPVPEVASSRRTRG
jgi:hypothetical protein